LCCCFFFSSRRRHTRSKRDWSSDVCSSDLGASSILIYRHFRSEAETTLLMEQAWKTGKRVYCPRVEGKTMEFFLVRTWEDFEQRSEERRVGKECGCGRSADA